MAHQKGIDGPSEPGGKFRVVFRVAAMTAKQTSYPANNRNALAAATRGIEWSARSSAKEMRKPFGSDQKTVREELSSRAIANILTKLVSEEEAKAIAGGGNKAIRNSMCI